MTRISLRVSDLGTLPGLTSLQHLIATLADNVQANDLFVVTLTDQLVRRRLLVLFLEHGKRHGLELPKESGSTACQSS